MSIFTVRLARSILGFLFTVFFTSHLTCAASASVSVGQSVSLSVAADGTAPFSYQWYKDGSPISGATNSIYSIGSFSASFAGSYSVVVANSAGSTISDVAALYLNDPVSSPVAQTPDTSSGLSDTSFESINVGSNSYTAFAYDPAGSAWSFAGSSGITGNSSGFTSGAPNAPDGSQVAFVQSTGSITQDVYLQTGTYAISALVANRVWGGQQTVMVYVDGWLAGTFNGGTTYSQATSNYFNVTAGVYTISFVGVATNDSTLFLDKISLTSASTGVSVGNSGFESPNVGSYYYLAFQYNPTTVAGSQDWTFKGYSGIAGNGSGFTVGSSNAPEGGQVAFLQSNGSDMAQSLSFPVSGNYTLSLSTAQRGNWNVASQQAYVYLDGNFIGSISPSSATFQTTTISFSASQGSHRLSFTSVVGGDSTLFLDRISITPN